MSALKSHLKCELSMVSSKIDSLSEFVNTKINNLNDQKILETQKGNSKGTFSGNGTTNKKRCY